MTKHILLLSVLIACGAGCTSSRPMVRPQEPSSAVPTSASTSQAPSVRFQESGLSSVLTLPAKEYRAVTSTDRGVQRFAFGSSDGSGLSGILSFFSKQTSAELSFDGCWRALSIAGDVSSGRLPAESATSFFLDHAVYVANDKKTTIMVETCEDANHALQSYIYWAPGVFQSQLGAWGNALWKKHDQVFLSVTTPYTDREQAIAEIHRIAESIEIVK